MVVTLLYACAIVSRLVSVTNIHSNAIRSCVGHNSTANVYHLPRMQPEIKESTESDRRLPQCSANVATMLEFVQGK